MQKCEHVDVGKRERAVDQPFRFGERVFRLFHREPELAPRIVEQIVAVGIVERGAPASLLFVGGHGFDGAFDIAPVAAAQRGREIFVAAQRRNRRRQDLTDKPRPGQHAPAAVRIGRTERAFGKRLVQVQADKEGLAHRRAGMDQHRPLALRIVRGFDGGLGGRHRGIREGSEIEIAAVEFQPLLVQRDQRLERERVGLPVIERGHVGHCWPTASLLEARYFTRSAIWVLPIAQHSLVAGRA